MTTPLQTWMKPTQDSGRPISARDRPLSFWDGLDWLSGFSTANIQTFRNAWLDLFRNEWRLARF